MNNRALKSTELGLTFFKIGSFSFGGGYAMLPLLEKELCERKGWVTAEELLDVYAIAQSTPGIIAINTATFTGYKTAGVLGAVAATLGMVMPSLIIITVIATSLNHFDEYPLIQKALMGVNIAVAVLLLVAVGNFIQKTVKNRWSLILCLGAFVAVAFAHLSPIPVVITAALSGLMTYFIRRGGRS